MDSRRAQQFEEVSIPHLDALFQTALYLTASRSEAEELVLETYAWAKRIADQRSAESTDCRLELFKVLFQRVQRRRQPKTNPAPSVLGQIPTALREVVLLVDCQDFSYREAGDVLGLTSETVAERISLGRKLLESGLSGSGLEGERENCWSGHGIV